jgi:HEAT repeat protein
MRQRTGILVAATLFLCGGSGCTEWTPPWEFWRQDPEEKLIESPAARIERYREWGKTARDRDPQEQVQLANQLVQAYKTELEGDPMIRREAVKSLGSFGTTAAEQVLHEAKSDAETSVRTAACEAWGIHGGERAIVELESVLRNERDQDVRHAAIRGLQNIQANSANPYAVVGALIVALDDKDPATRGLTLAALENVTGRYYGSDANAWRRFAKGENVPQQQRSLAQTFGIVD